MSIISFASSKGGAGKTTACIILGTEFAEQGRVTMIDADPAQRLVAWAKRGNLPAQITVKKCLDLKDLDSLLRSARDRSDVTLIDLEGIASRLNSAVIARSNLVIIPMGDEQQDATAAVETIREIKIDEVTLGRHIPYRVLFTRTKAAVKSNLAKMINGEIRKSVECLTVELCDRTAYSNLHNTGGGLRELPDRVGGLEKAIINANTFAGEVYAVLTNKSEQKGVA